LLSVGAGTLDADEFRSVPDLRYLDLSRNYISRLPADVGGRLSQLSTLNLSANMLTHLSAHAFVGAERLSVLDVSHNRIQVCFDRVLVVVAVWNRADHYIFILWFLSSSSSSNFFLA